MFEVFIIKCARILEQRYGKVLGYSLILTEIRENREESEK